MKIEFLHKKGLITVAALSLLTISYSQAMEKKVRKAEEAELEAKRLKVEREPEEEIRPQLEEYTIITNDNQTHQVPRSFINNSTILKNMLEDLPTLADIPVDVSSKALNSLKLLNDDCLEKSSNTQEFLTCLNNFLSNLDEETYREMQYGINYLHLTKKFVFAMDDFLPLLLMLLNSIGDNNQISRILDAISTLELLETNVVEPENLSMNTLRLTYALSSLLNRSNNTREFLSGLRDIIAMLDQDSHEKLISALDSIDFSGNITFDISNFIEELIQYLGIFKNKKLKTRIVDTLTALNVFDSPAINIAQTIDYRDQFSLYKGVTLLHMASMLGSTLLTKNLLKKGLAVDAEDPDEFTPLQYAIWVNPPELALPVAEVLLEAGADINVLDFAGATVLAWAVEHGKIEVVRFLLAHGADQNLAGEDEHIPLNIARFEGYPEIAALLEQHAAQ